MLQISTSVRQTTEVVALMPAALTTWAASPVTVMRDSPEMELPAQVSHFTKNACINFDILRCISKIAPFFLMA